MSRITTSRFLRSKDLEERFGVTRGTIWRWARDGLLPPKRQLGPNTVGWLESEIDDWWARRFPEEEAS